MAVTPDTETIEQRIVENQRSAVLLFDRDFILNYINPAGEMLFAVSARQLIGLRVRDLIRCPGALVESHLSQVVKSGQPFTERELSLPLAGGKEVTVDCTVIPLRQEGEIKEFLVELLQVDRQLRINREEQLLSRNQASRALVRGLAHEIKNPLGGVRGAAQLLERELDDPELKEYTQIIIGESDRLQTLVDRMLGPNRLPDRKPVNIHQVLERVVSLVQVETGNALTIKKDYDPSIPSLLGDSDQLIQACLNIVRNGVRAAGPSGVIGLRTRVMRHFTIGTKHYRLVLQVEISDNGGGIPKEIQERIFFPMVSGSSDGMGLGLSIAQSLINQHKGLIEFTSRPGETVFTISLPLEGKHG
ncbi:nitrogen regulation protein NR(II) [Candidatus Endoriftia persephone]|jgi:two-component system nitrogen regulation sensor histidine kinase GlnL|uniref:Sensory histidine kinase/phosphatase NtrB n=3 Tax=Gammaproteobacteria TaxID=1236 RepID=G2FGE5_9GAMM|nr:nitrogen regulation protein NR(II) [Candidatus Endoriftia persephone]EGW54056.1 nitrogen regulation protein NtrB [endosymbiont of Tevnia jerichonana (vent Tica)]USF87680.1 nitrogen regulation protein NR(II) [Candidatus Endoriftia persephone]